MSSTNGGNGGQSPNMGDAPAAPQLNVLAQYTKDLSFENPNAPLTLMPGLQPQISVQVGVQARPIKEDSEYEVAIRCEGKAEMADKSVLFSFDLTSAGVFRVQNIPKEQLSAIVMIECPRLLFPFAREIIASSVVSGGFPPLLIDPVDFVALYRNQLAPAQQA